MARLGARQAAAEAALLTTRAILFDFPRLALDTTPPGKFQHMVLGRRDRRGGKVGGKIGEQGGQVI